MKLRLVEAEFPNKKRGWQEWLRYWEIQYVTTFGIPPPGVSYTQRGKYKQMILSTIEKRGEDRFKSMIDFVFENHNYHPEWKDLSLSLICGSHALAEKINSRCEYYSANQQLELATW